MSKQVSIIVVTYNARDDLKECLQSLESQDYNKIEIIVVNDASTDDTREFVRIYQTQTAMQMIVVTNKKNLGVAGSRNVGIRHATGEIIAFTDADCVADRRWISELVKGYNDEGVAAVGGRIADDRTSNIWELTEKGHNFVARKAGYVAYIQGCNMSFESYVLRKFMFNDEIKYGYEEALLCDYLVREGYKIYYAPGAVVHHKHRSNLCSLLKQKYLRGESSIWYRKKQNKLVMLKRHLVLLTTFLCIPLVLFSLSFLYLSFLLFAVFCISLLRDEFIFQGKSIREIIITLPFLIFVEFSHFWGSMVGFARFRVLKKGNYEPI